MSFKNTYSDPIIDINLKDGVLKIIHASNKVKKIPLGTIVLESYSQLISFKFKEDVPVEFIIKNDENKNRENTFYKWTGEKLKWLPETDDVFQPNI